jgi:tetratricopeptide (TPR) repeat protein
VPSPKASPLPASIRALRTPIPPELAGTPLVFFVPQTPTPTPLWGYIPHPQYEAYGAGVAALQRGDLEDAVGFFDQVLALAGDLPDAHYLRAEALRLRVAADPNSSLTSPLLGDALAGYDRAILLDPAFAPAYVGRGRAILLRTFRTKPIEDLKSEDLPQDFARAIDADPVRSPTLNRRTSTARLPCGRRWRSTPGWGRSGIARADHLHTAERGPDQPGQI